MVLKGVIFRSIQNGLERTIMVLKGRPFLCTLRGSMALLLDFGSFLTHLVDGLEMTLLPDFSPWRLPVFFEWP